MRIIFCGQDVGFGRALKHYLDGEGHSVDWMPASEVLAGLLATNAYEGLVIDAGPMPLAQTVLLSQVRRRRAELHCIVVSAGSTPAQRVALFDHGADHVLDKPIDLCELSARLRRLMRCHGSAAPTSLRVGPLLLDGQARVVHWHERPVSLSKKEYRLLEVFLRGRGRVICRSDLERSLYGDEREIVSNAIDVHIHNLRAKLARDAIEAVRGVGYRLGPAVCEA